MVCFSLFAQWAVAQSTVLSVGDSLYALGNYTKAMNAYAGVGTDHSGLQIARAYKAIGNHTKAMAEYSALLERAPKLEIARFELGKLSLRNKHYDAARGLFDTLIANDGTNPEYHYYLGRTLESISLLEGANAEFRKAVALDSTHIRSLYALAKYFTSRGEKDSVLHYADQGLHFFADDVSMINLKATAYYNNGEYSKAIPFFGRLLELGERQAFVYRNLAFCHFRALDYGKAISNYRLLMRFPEYRVTAHSGLGEVFLQEKQLDSAEYHIKRSIAEQRVAFDREYADLGRIARLRGDTKGALDHYTKAWDENRENYLNYYQICLLADEYYKDPKLRLEYYEKLFEFYAQIPDFIGERAKKRISELRAEIHFAER